MIIGKEKKKPPTYAQLAKQLCINQQAWKGEEDSVKEEHESLINTNEQLIERLP